MVIRRMVAVVVAALGVAVGVVPSASAVSEVEVLCETGAFQFSCGVEHDAVVPFTTRWSFNGVPAPSSDDKEFTGTRRCGGTRAVLVRVVVADAGGSVERARTVPCSFA